MFAFVRKANVPRLPRPRFGGTVAFRGKANVPHPFVASLGGTFAGVERQIRR
jgi:hypothetical protein